MCEIIGKVEPEVLKERQERARTARPEVLKRIRTFGALRRKRQAQQRAQQAGFHNRPHVKGKP